MALDSLEKWLGKLENGNEENVKALVKERYFKKFEYKIFERLDFSIRKVDAPQDQFMMFAEAKRFPTDVYQMLTQLCLTIKKYHEKSVVPKYLGCFDSEKIAFVQYCHIVGIFSASDFNWTDKANTPSQNNINVLKRVLPQEHIRIFHYVQDDESIKDFVESNFRDFAETSQSIEINQNNFVHIFHRWLFEVKPHITRPYAGKIDWALLSKNYKIESADFFLAELNVDDRNTPDTSDECVAYTDFNSKFISSENEPYKIKYTNQDGLFNTLDFGFDGNGFRAYTMFWNKYKRPPKEQAWEIIKQRRDLLVESDVRERKGAFFTPRIWVEKSQDYLAKVLGEDWQDEYYVWDCCAGTGNLLFGLNNKRYIWASTLDLQDVEIMRGLAQNGSLPLFEDHVFQFDFLNDDFSRLPEGLSEIIADPDKRKKLVVYINPPYAEAGDAKQIAGTGKNKDKVAITTQIYDRYKPLIGKAAVELFAQFFIRIHQEIPGCTLAEFSKLKILQAPNFAVFRNVFRAKLEKLFLVPSWTFDNVNGKFPIGFFIWDTNKKETFKQINADVFDADGNFFGSKNVISTDDYQNINKWLVQYKDNEKSLGVLVGDSPDYQHNKSICINNDKGVGHYIFFDITKNNLFTACIYFAVRHCIEATWLNDRDQFLYPNDGWKSDPEFQTDCLIFTLFHGQNRITSEQGTNHWIPFSEDQLGAKKAFKSDFMVRFLCGKIKKQAAASGTIAFEETSQAAEAFVPCEHFSAEALAVFEAGRALWRYYLEQSPSNVDASLYDIRKFFQGVNDKGRMNTKSTDSRYNEHISALRDSLKTLAAKIAVKVYEYGFLR